MTSAILTQKLSRKFGSTYAVKDISLDIKQGEIYGFLGPNGAGKSTTVKMLVSLLKPTSGTITILGKDLSMATNDIRLLIGAALQEASLDENQTGSELLELQGRLFGLSKKEIAVRMKDLKQLIDIGGALDDRISTYSGGMKRRVDLAASLMHNPKVLFLDEPTTGLDPLSRKKVWTEIQRLNKQLNMTIFLTTQYLEEADQLAERVGIINKGKLAEEDTPTNLKKRIGADVITLEVDEKAKKIAAAIKKQKAVKGVDVSKNTLEVRVSDASKLLGDVVNTVTKHEANLLNISIRQASLDDVFIEVTGEGAKT